MAKCNKMMMSKGGLLSPTVQFATSATLLLGVFLLAAVQAAYRSLLTKEVAEAESAGSGLVLFAPFRRIFWSATPHEATIFCLSSALNLFRFCFALSAAAWLWIPELPPFHTHAVESSFHDWIYSVITLVGLFTVGFVVGDYLPRRIAAHDGLRTLRYCAPLASFYLLVALPLSWPLFVVTRRLVRGEDVQAQVGQELLELIHGMDTTVKLEAHDKKLIESVVEFRHQLAKEVMVPRVDVFSLPGHLSIREAARLLDPEGYSRIPVYGQSIDEIKGVLMHKDILRRYMEAEAKQDQTLLDAPIESLVKEVIFTPETKRISVLLQEFRHKKVHLAIVVDEYGGTEGIVTIEDILEQIVGEIADEYDQEEDMYVVNPQGGWIVDARMSILDVEEKLDVIIPEEGDYDTLAGFVFHCAGSIPSKGFVIHRDNLELEVLASNDRMVEKVWLKPTKAASATEHERSTTQT